MNQDLKSQRDKKYRENKKEIGEFLENSDNYLDEIWDSRMGVLEKTKWKYLLHWLSFAIMDAIHHFINGGDANL